MIADSEKDWKYPDEYAVEWILMLGISRNRLHAIEKLKKLDLTETSVEKYYTRKAADTYIRYVDTIDWCFRLREESNKKFREVLKK